MLYYGDLHAMTETVPVCIECKHHRRFLRVLHLCRHPRTLNINQVTGKTSSGMTCAANRGLYGLCRYWGDMFEPKDGPPADGTYTP